MTSIKFTAFRSLGLISGLCLALLAPSAATAGVIDSFTEDVTPTPLTSSGVANVSAQGGLASVIGGDRTTTVLRTSGAGTVGAEVLTGLGLFTFNSPATAAGKFTLAYLNLGGISVGPGFTIPIVFNDLGGVFSVSVEDGMGSISNNGLGTAIGAGVTGNFAIALVGFANYADIVKLTIMFQGVTGSDLTIGPVGIAVPEPSSLAIALTGLGFAGVYFRRRRNQLTA